MIVEFYLDLNLNNPLNVIITLINMAANLRVLYERQKFIRFYYVNNKKKLIN